MAIWFVRTDGSDSIAGVANGRDALGLSLSNATYDHTGNPEGERHLFSTSAFSGYTFTAGDTIYLLNAVGGVADGLYEIASKVDNDAILLVADAGLTADSTSDVDSSDGPFATIAYAINEGNIGNTALANGDDIRICANASHTSSNTISFDTVGGIDGTPLLMTGATALGVVDGTRATVDFSGTAGAEDGFEQDSALSAASFIDWQHLRITGAARHNIVMDEGSSRWRFFDCRIDNAGTNGIHNNLTAGGAGHYHALYNCEVDTNGGDGIGTSNVNRVGPSCYGCSIHDNTGDGLEVGEGGGDKCVIYGCVIYDNGSVGIRIKKTDSGIPAPEGLRVLNCTIEGNSSDGISYDKGAGGLNNVLFVQNTTLTNNGGYGVNMNGDPAYNLLLSHCWFYNNTSGDLSDSYSITDDLWIGGDNTTTGTDPQYTSLTDGSEDLEPASGSGLIGAGFPGALQAGGTGSMDIGAVQRAQSAGGFIRLRSNAGLIGR